MHADEIISVHHSVDEPVEQDGEVNVTIVHDIGVEPVEQKDCCVMVNMQERQLAPLLSQDNENSIPKVPHLRNVEEPKEVGKRRILYVEIVTGHRRVSVTVSQHSRLNGHVGTQEDL